MRKAVHRLTTFGCLAAATLLLPAELLAADDLESVASGALLAQRTRDREEFEVSLPETKADDSFQAQIVHLRNGGTGIIALSMIGRSRGGVVSRLTLLSPKGEIIAQYPGDPFNKENHGFHEALPGEGYFTKARVFPVDKLSSGIALTYCRDGRHGKEGVVVITAESPARVLLHISSGGAVEDDLFFYDFDDDGDADIFVKRASVEYAARSSKLIHSELAFLCDHPNTPFRLASPSMTEQFGDLMTVVKSKAIRLKKSGGMAVDNELYEESRRKK